MMTKRFFLLFAAVMVGVTGIAGAWGPSAETSVVTTAARMVAREDGIPLTNLLDHVRAGASVSPADLNRLIPNAETSPVDAIAAEMYVLQRVRTDRVDPYMAYRFGVLGKLVAATTSPVSGVDSAVRTQYNNDVDGQISRATLRSAPRREVDAGNYFSRLESEIAARGDLIEADYRQGQGFSGVASQALSQDLSRSVHAVADVWYTILAGRARMVSIGDDRIRAYHTGALEYYTERRHSRETEATYQRLEATGLKTTETQKRIADMFYESQQYDRAMQEYRAVLSQEPGRRDVIARMSEYYVGVGEEALERGQLEQAFEAFEAAAEVDTLNDDVQQRVIDTRRAIAERDRRRERDREAVETAASIEREAEDLIAAENTALAMELLVEAERIYASVSDEFPEERRAAQSGHTNVTRRLEQIRGQLFANVQNLSGSGDSAAVRARVRANASALAEQALRDMVEAEYEKEMDRLTRELDERADSSP